MGILTLAPNIPDPDGFYERLIDAHRGLNDADSALLNARLILLLANQIGDRAVLDAALEKAASL
ncbi:MAG: DUF2783 domain-containing protein [Pseudomonadota bacterium]